MTNIERDNTRFVRGQQQETMEMIEQQDVALDSLGNAVDRLEGMGRTINTELKGMRRRYNPHRELTYFCVFAEQNRLLDELDQDIDDAGEKMNFVMGKLSKLLKTKDGCQIWSIVILSLILIILVGLVVFL